MRYIITQKDLRLLKEGEEVSLYIKDSRGYHWTSDTVVLDGVEE